MHRRFGDQRKRVWRTIAFLGRYGHQPCDVCLKLPMDDLTRLAEAVGTLLEEEAAAVKDGDD